MRILLTGATGFIGGRLLPQLLDAGHAVTCLVRDPARLAAVDPDGRARAAVGDVTDATAVAAAFRTAGRVDALVHLVHTMDGPDFAARDRAGADALAVAVRAAGVDRIVYLSGLQPGPTAVTSTHLASRREVGERLAASGAATAVLQAGIVVGAGSASFALVRAAAELTGPVLPLPDRAWNRVQPVAVDDVVHHLAACVNAPRPITGTFDVGGPDVLTYHELISQAAVAMGRPRPLVVAVPGSAPRLLARLAEAATGVDRHLVGPLLESMGHDLVCRPGAAPPTPPPPGGPTAYVEAVARAVAASRPPDPFATAELPAGVLSEQRSHAVAASPAALWAIICGLGGDTGWYTVPGVWAARGALDRLVGGIGARRTVPAVLTPGAALDWWRVEAVDPGRLLRLRAEMRLPGTAWVEWRVEPGPAGARLVQRTVFHPDGAVGRAYWYGGLTAHRFVFGVTARTIADLAERRAADADADG